jgi:uncharacterized repeat protein (TIGR03803 family)
MIPGKLRLLKCTLAAGGLSTAIAGCGPAANFAVPAGTSAGATRELGNSSYRTVYTFKAPHDRTYGPTGELSAIGGEIYGTTYFGGPHGHGTVFSLTTSGVLHFLYKFKGGNGGGPNGGLTGVGGVLYGTTNGGGNRCFNGSQNVGCGAVFSTTTSGDERTIYRFKGGADGFSPNGGLIALDGKLYGTTTGGGGTCSIGGAGCGVVFSVDTGGHERVLYRFQKFRDGLSPNGSLLALEGKLYGTTTDGGSNKCYDGCGALFEITTSGVETVLYRFRGGHDGQSPNGGLIAIDGVMYGTTSVVSVTGCVGSEGGCGTVFKATTSGDVSTIYRFKGTPDAAAPYGNLIADHGELYGTSIAGGQNCLYWDSGTVFAVSTAGNERVVHRFLCKSAFEPNPGLLLLRHALYGTTYGGAGNVFAVTP